MQVEYKVSDGKNHTGCTKIDIWTLITFQDKWKISNTDILNLKWPASSLYKAQKDENLEDDWTMNN